MKTNCESCRKRREKVSLGKEIELSANRHKILFTWTAKFFGAFSITHFFHTINTIVNGDTQNYHLVNRIMKAEQIFFDRAEISRKFKLFAKLLTLDWIEWFISFWTLIHDEMKVVAGDDEIIDGWVRWTLFPEQSWKNNFDSVNKSCAITANVL